MWRDPTLSHLLRRHHDSSEFAAGRLIDWRRAEHVQAPLERFTILANGLKVPLRVYGRNDIDLEFGLACPLIR